MTHSSSRVNVSFRAPPAALSLPLLPGVAPLPSPACALSLSLSLSLIIALARVVRVSYSIRTAFGCTLALAPPAVATARLLAPFTHSPTLLSLSLSLSLSRARAVLCFVSSTVPVYGCDCLLAHTHTHIRSIDPGGKMYTFVMMMMMTIMDCRRCEKRLRRSLG